MKILVAENDELVRNIVRLQLSRDGHEVFEAADGRAAWELLRREPIRLLITDWNMPEMTGPELIRWVRASAFPAYTYIILFTVRSTAPEIVEGLKAGADDYLIKPFNADELRARVAIGERILNLEAHWLESIRRVENLATQDSLTGLLNRRTVYEHADAELSRAGRENTTLSLVMLDIDHFKSVNDRFGHAMGDEALRMVTNLLLQAKRSYDWAGRWGGEEFLLVLPRTDTAAARIVAGRLRKRVAAKSLMLPGDTALHLTISSGLMSIAPQTRDELPVLDVLIQQADAALYRAKREGRNRVCVYTPEIDSYANSEALAHAVRPGAN